jgi:Skp family chaperone for outer membrane proteins
MKFLVSFFALALYFVFALADTAEEITYTNSETTVAASPSAPASETDRTVAPTPRQEKAGFAF